MVNPVQTLRTSGVGIETARSTLQPCSLTNVFKTTGNSGHSPNILSQVWIYSDYFLTVNNKPDNTNNINVFWKIYFNIICGYYKTTYLDSEQWIY